MWGQLGPCLLCDRIGHSFGFVRSLQLQKGSRSSIKAAELATFVLPQLDQGFDLREFVGRTGQLICAAPTKPLFLKSGST